MGSPRGISTALLVNAFEYSYNTTRSGATPGELIKKAKLRKVIFAQNDVVSDVVYTEK